MGGNEMKRYLVFGYSQYYPSGGATDAQGSADTLDEVRKITAGAYDAYDVLDMQERRWLDESEWAGAK